MNPQRKAEFLMSVLFAAIASGKSPELAVAYTERMEELMDAPPAPAPALLAKGLVGVSNSPGFGARLVGFFR